MTSKPSILFTAFEPSGDAHAAPVIEALRREVPKLAIYAWGGPRMAAAGATLVASTAEDGAMGLSSFAHVRRVHREIKAIKRWSARYRVLAHVAVDSPAANFPICKVMRGAGARIVHLVAPQLWAWASWRARKLRNRTDLVLCLLPFEEQWFRERGIPARFIGHPRMNRKLDEEAIRARIKELPQGAPRVGLFPGSRTQEIHANIRLMVNVYAELRSRHAQLGGVIAAANPALARLIRKKIPTFPTGLHMTSGEVEPVIAWSDLCLACSGTVTLDITRQQKAMVGLYKTGVIAWLGSKLVLRTPLRLLPNIIAEREIVPEFVPHCGGAGPIAQAAHEILHDSKLAAIQSQELARVCQRYVNKKPAQEAARLILTVIKEGKITD